jgi:hypothetical protein
MFFAGLIKLLPFRDYAYAAAAAAALVWYNVHVHNLEVAYGTKQVAATNAAYADASAKTLSAAKKLLDAKDAQHAQDLAKVEANYETQLKASANTHAADLQRLRQLAANESSSDSNSVLAGSGGSGSSAGAGGSSLVGLGYVSAELASALHDARNDLRACYADRDSLTGK